jgi:hypothetical protein
LLEFLPYPFDCALVLELRCAALEHLARHELLPSFGKRLVEIYTEFGAFELHLDRPAPVQGSEFSPAQERPQHEQLYLLVDGTGSADGQGIVRLWPGAVRR